MLSTNSDLRAQNFRGKFVSWHVVNILHMTAQIAALRECFRALWALEWSLTRMLPEVIPEVATLLEDTVAALVLAFEEQLYTLG